VPSGFHGLDAQWERSRCRFERWMANCELLRSATANMGGIYQCASGLSFGSNPVGGPIVFEPSPPALRLCSSRLACSYGAQLVSCCSRGRWRADGAEETS
jgi:hypothetical protein